MSTRRSPVLSLLPFAALAVACSSAHSVSIGPGESTTHASSQESSASSSSGPQCIAEMVWLQKDAYKDTPGRSALWPPHTTTTLTVSCPDATGTLQQVDYAFNDNHGTDPTTRDDAGALLLLETKSMTVPGTKDELEQLFSTYKTCVCDPVTQFLSMDSLSSAGAKELLNSVGTYFEQNLVCAIPGGTKALVQELASGNIDSAAAQLSACTWSNGASFNDGLDAALVDFLKGTKETLAGYHVCNNDATLQATLLANYASTRTVVACDKASATCKGPIWFYTP